MLRVEVHNAAVIIDTAVSTIQLHCRCHRCRKAYCQRGNKCWCVRDLAEVAVLEEDAHVSCCAWKQSMYCLFYRSITHVA